MRTQRLYELTCDYSPWMTQLELSAHHVIYQLNHVPYPADNA